MNNELLQLSIRSREGVMFEGRVNSITSYNEQGKFDILPQHANIISLLSEEILYVDDKGEKKALKIDSALLRKKDHIVEIYLGIKAFSEDTTTEPDSGDYKNL